MEKEFPWSALGNLTIGRPNLGVKTDVAVYRLMQFTMRDILEDEFGEIRCREILRKAGKRAGMAYCANVLDGALQADAFLANLSSNLIKNGIGIIRIEKSELHKFEFVLTVSEDLDCSGLPVSGNTVCDYDEGFLAGIMEKYTGILYEVKEIDCWATGARTCRFEVRQTEDENDG